MSTQTKRSRIRLVDPPHSRISDFLLTDRYGWVWLFPACSVILDRFVPECICAWAGTSADKQAMNPRYTFLAAFVFILFLVAYIGFTFSGYYFYDDYGYAEYAHQMLEGTFQVQYDTFSHRLAFMLPVAAIYALAGINDCTTVLWPFLCTVGTVALLLIYLRPEPVWCLFAVLATGLNSYFLFFVDKLFPDTPLTFFLLAAGIVAERYRDSYPTRAGAGTVLLLFIAFMTKETAVYAFPFFAIFILRAYLAGAKVGRKYAMAAILTGISLMTLYFLGYYVYTGNPLYRFTSIVDNHYIHAGTYFDKPLAELVKRLTYLPWVMFLECGMLVVMLPGFIVALGLIFGRKAGVPPMLRFWAWYGVLMLVAYWFVSTSTRYYTPLPLSPRMYFPLLPVFAILSGWYWRQAGHSPYVRVVLSLLYGISALAGIILHSKYTLVYVGLSIVPWLYFLKRSEKMKNGLTVTAFAGVLLIVPVYRMWHPQQWGYQAEKRIFSEYFLPHTAGRYLVITDERLAVTYHWYNRFQSGSKGQFVDFSAFTPALKANYPQTFVLFNPHTFVNSPLPLKPWENWEQQYGSQLKLLTEQDGVRLYEWK